MDLLKRQEIVIEKSTELKKLAGFALSLDECEEFVSEVLKASDEASNCILGVVSQQRELLLAYEKFSDKFYEIDSSKPSTAMIDMFLSKL